MTTYAIFVRCNGCHTVLELQAYSPHTGRSLTVEVDELGDQHEATCPGRLLTPIVATADRHGRGHVPGQVSDLGVPLREYPIYKVPETTGPDGAPPLWEHPAGEPE